jgi:hypothetical protein
LGCPYEVMWHQQHLTRSLFVLIVNSKVSQ